MGVAFSRLFGFGAPSPAPTLPGARVVVITGCDTGFGQLLALRLGARGYAVVAACLGAGGAAALADAARAQKTAVLSDDNDGADAAPPKAGIRTVLVDVTKDDDVARLKAVVEARYPRGIHAVVNNAGIGMGGFVEWTSMAAYRRVLDVNFFGVVAVTKAMMPSIRRARGRVVNVASMFGRIAVQSVSAYCASKHAVEAFSDSLRREVWPFGVHVSLIEPGFAKTPINHNTFEMVRGAYDSAPADVRAAYGDAFADSGRDSVTEILRDALEPEVVVDAMVHAVDSPTPRIRYLIGKDAWALTFANMLPGFIGDWFAARSAASWSIMPTQAIFKGTK